MLNFSLACGEYDRTDALLSGRVAIKGAEPVLLGISDAYQRHKRMLLHGEFDVAEVSLSSYLIAKDRGEPLVGIPVFPYRMFRHQFILVRSDSGIDRPEDLIGRRIGTPMYQTTTMLWVRGMLEDVYGVRASDVEWVTDREELLPISPGGVSISPSPPGSTVERMFTRKELDALVLIEEVPEDLLARDGIERLFPDFPGTEEDYYRRTGIFPIMHAVVMREDLYSANRWLARNIFDAFVGSLEEAVERQRFPRVMNLAWAASYVERERRIFGGSPYVHGVAANAVPLEAATRYAHRQGLTGRAMELADIFVPELLDT
ncbi:MAG TPA: ABC transporter substrate-binding protein [Acidimicrobiales bacterium]|nr:ABC transporter substrate-binding protein [Acidimicrobiales bacterium]